MALAGDLDGDGIQDLLVNGSRSRGGDDGDSRGRAFVFSGGDGRRLMILEPPPVPEKWTLESSGGAEGVTSVVGAVGQAGPEAKGVLLVETCDDGPGTGLIVFVSAGNGKVVRSIQRGAPILSGGNSRVVGDVDLDGVRDIALFARFGWSSREEGVIGIRVISGESGKECLRLGSPESGSWESSVSSMCDAGDMDGDGYAEIAVGFDTASVGQVREAGRVDVFSGKDGRRVFSLRGLTAHGGFGTSVCAAGDLDGDGVGDLVVGAKANHGQRDPAPGEVTAVSVKGMKRLWSTKGEGKYENMGAQVVGIGDVNGDKRRDIAVSCAAMNETWTRHKGRVVLLSGADGSVVRSMGGEESEDRHFGLSLVACGDVDGDHVADIAVGAPADLRPGLVLVYSGKTGGLIRTLMNPEK